VFVTSAEGFAEQHLVANGASELLSAVLGEGSVHARAAVGVASLPRSAPVEVEAMLTVVT
jgi:enamine deaminase RidA (YjgF/YER057c/UK114 family)